MRRMTMTMTLRKETSQRIVTKILLFLKTNWRKFVNLENLCLQLCIYVMGMTMDSQIVHQHCLKMFKMLEKLTQVRAIINFSSQPGLNPLSWEIWAITFLYTQLAAPLSALHHAVHSNFTPLLLFLNLHTLQQGACQKHISLENCSQSVSQSISCLLVCKHT